MYTSIFESAIDELNISDIHKNAIKQLHKACYEGAFQDFNNAIGPEQKEETKTHNANGTLKTTPIQQSSKQETDTHNADGTLKTTPIQQSSKQDDAKKEDGKKEESPQKTTQTNQNQNSKPKAVLPKLPIYDVKLVQAFLNEKKNVDLNVDGKMGPKTMKAIQRTEDLIEDGKWGPRTKEAYQSLLDEAKKTGSETKESNEQAAAEPPKQMPPEKRDGETNKYGNLLTNAIQKSIGEDFNTARKIANNINMEIINNIKKKKNDQYIVENIKTVHKLSNLSNEGWNAIQALITHHRKANNIPESEANMQEQTLQSQAYNILLNVWRQKKENGDDKLKNATELHMKKNAWAKVKKWDKETIENFIKTHSQDNNAQQKKTSDDTIKTQSNESELEMPPTPSDKEEPTSRKQEFKIGINGVEGDDGVPFETAKKNYSHTFEANLRSLYSKKSKGYSEQLDKQIRKEFHTAIGEYAVRNTGDITNLLQHLIEMNGGEVKSEQMLYDQLQLAIRSSTKDYATYVKSYEAMKKEK